MANTCQAAQDMCNLFRGDTFAWNFTFKDKDGVPIDISGMTLFFTMKQNPTSPDLEVGDLQESVTFPADSESALGIGFMQVLPAKTGLLIPKKKYHYDFQLVDGSDVVLTLGWGRLTINQDITQAVA